MKIAFMYTYMYMQLYMIVQTNGTKIELYIALKDSTCTVIVMTIMIVLARTEGGMG